MFNAMTRRVRRLADPVIRPASDRMHRASTRARDTRLRLQIPNPYGGAPWLTATVALASVPCSYGETLRLRAHLVGCMQGPERQSPALAPAVGGQQSLVRQGREAAASLVRSVFDRLPAERVSALTGRRWRSWLDLQLSTAPLDAGAQALMPEQLRELYPSALPRAGAGAPRIGVWSGPAGGPAGGVASLAMLQLDETDLGGKRNADEKGFNMSLYLAQVVDPIVPDSSI